jgi:hypothetical protein
MAQIAQPSGELARVLDLIAAARTITSLNHDQDLIERITVLQEYAELSAMFPERDYGPVIRKGTAELQSIVQNILNLEEITANDRTEDRGLKTQELFD